MLRPALDVPIIASRQQAKENLTMEPFIGQIFQFNSTGETGTEDDFTFGIEREM